MKIISVECDPRVVVELKVVVVVVENVVVMRESPGIESSETRVTASTHHRTCKIHMLLLIQVMLDVQEGGGEARVQRHKGTD